MAVILPFPYDYVPTKHDINQPEYAKNALAHRAMFTAREITIHEADKRIAIDAIIRTALKRLYGSAKLDRANYKSLLWEQYGATSSAELSTDQMTDLLRRIINLASPRPWRRGRQYSLSPEDQSALLAKVTALLNEKGFKRNGSRDNEGYF